MQAGDYKTGRAYGERPPMVIAPAIYPEVRPLPLIWLDPLLLDGHGSCGQDFGLTPVSC